jgi:hypothetical protein
MPPLTPAQLQAQVDKLNESLNQVNDSIKDIGADLSGGVVKGLVAAVENTRKLANNLTESKDLSKDIVSANKDLNKQIVKNEQLSVAKAIAEQKLAKAIKDNNRNAEKRYKDELSSLRTQIKLNEQIEDQIRKVAQVAEEEKKISDEKKKQNSLGETLKKTLKDTFQPFKEIFTVAGIFKIMIDSALRFNKISTEVGKSLGYGADKADQIASKFVGIAQSSTNINVTLANLGEAMSQLSEATGFVADYSADALETQIMLTKQFGLTGDEAAGIYQLSVLTGKSSSKVNDSMVGAFVNARNQLRVGVPFKAVMAEAAKVSGQLAANLGNNPSQIVKAVTQAKALGTTLEQVKNQGEALLNFESSIENELKAELLTGKQLNLERARAAALTGDQVTLAEELNKNVGTLEEFQGMNVLQQKALAEAVGLTADQLADQLKKQKIAQETGKSLAQITKEEAIDAEKRQAVQDKFNQAIIKLQDFFGNLVAGPLGKFLEILTAALPLITSIATVFAGIYAVQKGIAAFESLKLGYQVAQRGAALGYNGILLARQAIMKGELVKAIGIAAAYAVANPFKALIGLGVAAAVAGGIYALTTADDMIQPGYGKRTIVGPEGSIALNDKDTIVAGTDLGGGGSTGGGSMSSVDLTPMIVAINEVKVAIKELMNRPVIVNMDSKQVGSSLVQNASYKSA